MGRGDAEQHSHGPQRVTLVGCQLLRRQRIERCVGKQRSQGGHVKDGSADHRTRGVERIVVDGLELTARAALLEERPADAEEMIRGGEDALPRVFLGFCGMA